MKPLVKNLYALAKQFVCMIIASTLSLTVSVVEAMLPRRPEWLEKIALLEAQMTALAAGGGISDSHIRTAPVRSVTHDLPHDDDTPATEATLPADFQGLVDGYAKLLELTQYIKLRGLMLDPEFCERVEREWTVKTLLSYMISAEKSLKEQASEAHDQAAALLSSRSAGS